MKNTNILLLLVSLFVAAEVGAYIVGGFDREEVGMDHRKSDHRKSDHRRDHRKLDHYETADSF